ncbi:hypothetical protein PAPHI01_1328 [Pancytospora philotis]|nr:hypothetical protein PAPHI01_1328 [Pancytospora philotis]
MFGQALLVAARFACALASTPAEPLLLCTPSQLEAKRTCVDYHESIARLANEVMPALQPTVFETRELCKELVSIFECTQQAHTDKNYAEFLIHLLTIRPCLRYCRKSFISVDDSVARIVRKRHAVFLETCRYLEYIKQYLRMAGLACDYEFGYPVNLKTDELMEVVEVGQSTIVLEKYISSWLKSLRNECARLRGKGMSARARYSIMFHIANLELHYKVLQSLYKPTQALVSSYNVMAKKYNSILDASSPADFFKPHFKLQECLMALRNASRDLPQADSEWYADFYAAKAKAGKHTARLSASYLLDVSLDQLASASAVSAAPQVPASDSSSANVPQGTLHPEH